MAISDRATRCRWAINRARVRLARMIWPCINPLPPLFTVESGPVTIDSIAVYAGDELLYEAEVGITLAEGDSFSFEYGLEITATGGRKRILAEMSPVDGIPVKLYRSVGQTIADGVSMALEGDDGDQR